MALGSNLKRIKKDSLIPAKKEKPIKANPKTAEKVKAPISKLKTSSKQKVKLKSTSSSNKASNKQLAKAELLTLKNKGSKTSGSKQKKVKAVASKSKNLAKPKKESEAKNPSITLVENKKKSTSPLKSKKPNVVANFDEQVLVGGEEGAVITAKLIPSRRKTVRKTKLIFQGSLSLSEAEAIKKCLVTTFSKYDIIDINLLNITQLDIIPIQMIKLFVGFYPDKKINIDSDLPFDMKIIVERAGFGSLMFKEEAA